MVVIDQAASWGLSGAALRDRAVGIAEAAEQRDRGERDLRAVALVGVWLAAEQNCG